MEKRMDETMDAEKFLKELIHRALLGDEQAQQECTEKGIVLPCPFCGGEAIIEFDSVAPFEYDVVCGDCGVARGISEDKQVVLREWNTRLAPPVGRCRDCLWYLPTSKICKYSLGGLWGEVNELSFCSCFNPKED